MPKQLTYTELPLTNDPRQVFTTDLSPDATPLHARIEIRYLSAPGRWVITIWDNAAATLLANQVPLVCSRGFPLDLLYPFRHLRNGKGIGSLFVLRNTDSSTTTNPAKDNLTDYQIIYGDMLIPPTNK